ncbi:hypothetical protein GCM10010234_40960 [Streptomyces hawaiiensis]|uniref:hypothetical protein n=1 Tax=Streptomyces hawaiiensis TaxID=67305 RepID=UPI0031DDF663
MTAPSEFRSRAEELDSRVPPTTAAPRTDDERIGLDKARELQREAHPLEAAGDRSDKK